MLRAAGSLSALLLLASCIVVPANQPPASRPAPRADGSAGGGGPPGASDPQPPASAPATAFLQLGERCDQGARPVSIDEARGQHEALCALLGEWDIARLADGGSMDGPGYGCTIKARDDRPLGHALCAW